ncbi:OmpA family protein [Treponema pectinovorum]|uniref:OmpA family protein n=1 Tax=Treponema pectinovorum TaxID=164 RepID=UPI0011C7AB5C|nr:OmpA family protein [Treponema pectinovorum]
MKNNKKIFLSAIFSVFVLIFAGGVGFSDDGGARKIVYKGDGGYSLVERINLRRYVDGKYVGLTSREVRSFISVTEVPNQFLNANSLASEGATWYDGSFYVQEATKRNSVSVGSGIHESVQAIFCIASDGKLTMFKDNGYPSFRNFPAYSMQAVKSGDSWKASGERSVDPLNKGVFTKIPMLVLYTFAGEEIYSVAGPHKGESIYRIKAVWQTNYGKENLDFAGDSSLVKASGGHKADIIVLKKSGIPILISDIVDETFVFVDGTQVSFKGNITLFTEFPVPIDSQKIMSALDRVATAKNNILAEETASGIKLSIRDIKFAPDSVEISWDEEKRLDEIAEILKLAPNSKFLVEGHTASVGKFEGERILSERRAHKICEELIKRGVVSLDFICRGFGGTKPVASNDTEEGRAQNRRVEITILK